MILRESIELEGNSINLEGLTDPNCTRIEGIPHSEELLRFCDTFIGDDKSALAQARDALAAAMGTEAMIDAAGIASNFQRMDRIADATGIPTEGLMAVMQEDLVSQLGTDQYQSASNTKPVSWIQRLLFKYIVIPKVRKFFKDASN